jgi:hypothetical protein
MVGPRNVPDSSIARAHKSIPATVALVTGRMREGYDAGHSSLDGKPVTARRMESWELMLFSITFFFFAAT